MDKNNGKSDLGVDERNKHKSKIRDCIGNKKDKKQDRWRYQEDHRICEQNS